MGIGGHWWILLILAVIALIIFGPSRLPELGSGLGKAIKEFRKATTEVGEGLREELHKTETATGTTYTQAPTPAAATGEVPPAATGPAVTPAVTPAPSPPPEAPKA